MLKKVPKSYMFLPAVDSAKREHLIRQPAGEVITDGPTNRAKLTHWF